MKCHTLIVNQDSTVLLPYIPVLTHPHHRVDLGEGMVESQYSLLLGLSPISPKIYRGCKRDEKPLPPRIKDAVPYRSGGALLLMRPETTHSIAGLLLLQVEESIIPIQGILPKYVPVQVYYLGVSYRRFLTIITRYKNYLGIFYPKYTLAINLSTEEKPQTELVITWTGKKFVVECE